MKQNSNAKHIDYHDIRIPDFIARHIEGVPEFDTQILKVNSDREIRSQPIRNGFIYKYKVNGCRLNKQEFMEFHIFFISRRGMKKSFRLFDYGDHRIERQVLVDGSASTSKIQLIKVYSDGKFSFSRKITKPIGKTIKLFVDGRDFSDYLLDETSGIITLKRTLGKTEVLSGTVDFDVEVRFGSDSYDYRIAKDGSVLIDKLELIEVCR